MVVLQQVTVTYGRRAALQDVSLTVPAGGSLALWGPNGAGKSTAFNAILGLVPYRGHVLIGGCEARQDEAAVRRQIGWVPQEFASLDMSPRRAARFLADLREIRLADPAGYLADFGLAACLELPAAALSGGQRGRLALALALIGDPPVLLLDEPTASLDAAGRRQVLDLLADLRRRGKTLLLASHRWAEVRRLADQVAMLADGRLLRVVPVGAVSRRLRLVRRDAGTQRTVNPLRLPAASAQAASLAPAPAQAPGREAEPCVCGR